LVATPSAAATRSFITITRASAGCDHVVGVEEINPSDAGCREQGGDMRRDPPGAVDRDGTVLAGIEQFSGTRTVPGGEGGQVSRESRHRRREPGIAVGLTVGLAAGVDPRPEIAGFGEAGQRVPRRVLGVTVRRRGRGAPAGGDELAHGRGVDAFDEHGAGAEFELDDVLGAPEDTNGGVEHHVDRGVAGHRPTVAWRWRHGPVIHRVLRLN